MSPQLKNNMLVLLGAAVGGILGYFIFFWIVGQGFYGLALPGGLMGLGAGITRANSKPIPVVSGVLALILGIFTEWRFAPFLADDSLGYFMAHLHQLRPITWIMILLGSAVAFWIPFRRLLPAANDQAGRGAEVGKEG
ncbi:MAG: hypothetical protein ACPGVU_15825 [Limisphaerales bacterium]